MDRPLDRLTFFGLCAVTAMLVCHMLEDRNHWFGRGFAAACAAGSAYGFLQGAWPFGGGGKGRKFSSDTGPASWTNPCGGWR